MRGTDENAFSTGRTGITKREMRIGVYILLVAFVIGIIAISIITSVIKKTNKIYSEAVRIESKEMYDQALSEGNANGLVYGKFTVSEPVKLEELNGTYGYIVRTKEKYTRHKKKKRAVTYKWDIVETEYFGPDTIKFMGHDYKADKFFVSESLMRLDIDDSVLIKQGVFQYIRDGYVCEDDVTSSGDYRYNYSYLPIEFEGNMLVSFKNNEIEPVVKDSIEIVLCTIDERFERLQFNEKSAPVIFWSGWIILIIVGSVIYLKIKKS